MKPISDQLPKTIEEAKELLKTFNTHESEDELELQAKIVILFTLNPDIEKVYLKLREYLSKDD